MENILDLPEATSKPQSGKTKKNSLTETAQQRNIRLIITFAILFVALLFAMWIYSSVLASESESESGVLKTVGDTETVLQTDEKNENSVSENLNEAAVDTTVIDTENNSSESTSDSISVDDLLLMPMGEDVYIENGTYDTTTVKPGYYTVTTTGMARLMITGEDGSLVTLTTLGTGKSCSKSYTAMISAGDTIDVTGLDGLDSVIFTPVDHKLMTEVGPGVYTAGVDVLSGTVKITAKSGYGCVSVISPSGIQRESVTLASADSTYEADGESIVVNLTNGDQLNVYMLESVSVNLEK